jgi:hypothetical protein
VAYLQVPPLHIEDGRYDMEVLFDFRNNIILLGLFPPLEDDLRPLWPLALLSRGWRLPLGGPRPQGLLGLPRCLGLLAYLLAHLFRLNEINYIS